MLSCTPEKHEFASQINLVATNHESENDKAFELTQRSERPKSLGHFLIFSIISST